MRTAKIGPDLRLLQKEDLINNAYQKQVFQRPTKCKEHYSLLFSGP